MTTESVMRARTRIGVVCFVLGLPAFALANGAAPHAALNINALGFLQFGPTIAAEFGGHHVSAQVHARVMNAGMLSYLVLPLYYEDYPSFKSGLGVAALVRWYSGGKGNMRGAFFGGGLEWMTYSVEEDEGTTRYRLREVALIPQLQGGYRWAFDRFHVGAGGGAGPVFNYGNEIEALPGNTEPNLVNEGATTFYGLLFAELGIYL